MIGLPSLSQLDRASPVRIWLCTAPTDMRRSFGRLAEQAQQVTRQDPRSGHLFVFRSRGGDRLKVLLWDEDGYLLYYKRLEIGIFKLPQVDAARTSVELRASELAMILDGIDLASVKRVKRFRQASAASSSSA